MGNMASASAKPSGSAVPAAASKPEPPKPKAPILKAAEEEAKPSATATRAPRIMTMREWREEKQFKMFLISLLGYLAPRDVATHTQARAIIKECYEKNKAGQPIDQNLISSTKVRLHLAVGEVHWKKAHVYLHQELMEMVNSNKKEWAASVKTTLSKKGKAASGKAKTVKKKGGSAKAAAPRAKK